MKSKKPRSISTIKGPHPTLSVVPLESVAGKILLLRGHKVLLSSDLAPLYGVQVRALVQAVKRNMARFPEDFMFQLNARENRILKSQIVTSRWGGARRSLPYAFTEQGIAMLSSVLRSERAIRVNIEIMRAFVKLRRLLATNENLKFKIEQIERRYDARFQAVFAALKEMLDAPVKKKKAIGFHT